MQQPISAGLREAVWLASGRGIFDHCRLFAAFGSHKNKNFYFLCNRRPSFAPTFAQSQGCTQITDTLHSTGTCAPAMMQGVIDPNQGSTVMIGCTTMVPNTARIAGIEGRGEVSYSVARPAPPKGSTTPSPRYWSIPATGGPYRLPSHVTLDASGTVTSVFGRTSDVTAQSGDHDTLQIAERDDLYFTAGRAQAAIPVAGLPLIYARGGISINKANRSQAGYLSSGDWNAFTGKEPTITTGSTSQCWRGDKTWKSTFAFVSLSRGRQRQAMRFVFSSQPPRIGVISYVQF
jgi:hypothetical protein